MILSWSQARDELMRAAAATLFAVLGILAVKHRHEIIPVVGWFVVMVIAAPLLFLTAFSFLGCMIGYVFNIWVAWDQLGNTYLGGDPDETISSRLSKWVLMPGWRGYIGLAACNILDWIDSGHSVRYHESDEGKDAILASRQHSQDVWNEA